MQTSDCGSFYTQADKSRKGSLEVQHFGSRRQFGAALNARRAERFKASGYKPELVDQAAPQVEFVTLAGEAFNAEKLSGKTVIVNFWSPG